MVILLIWRIWQLINDVVHGKDVPPVETTKEFLDSYYKSLDLARNHSMDEIMKGKMLLQEEAPCKMVKQEVPPAPWPPPLTGWTALRWFFLWSRWKYWSWNDLASEGWLGYLCCIPSYF